MQYLKIFIFLVVTFLFADDIIQISIPNEGYIEYEYEKGLRVKIVRLSQESQVLYYHSYQYDNSKNLLSETLIGELGEITYEIQDNKIACMSPYSSEIIYYDGGISKQVIDDLERSFSNEKINIQCEYDQNGNLIQKCSSRGIDSFFYDEQGYLIHVIKPSCEVRFSYNDQHQRTSKNVIKNGKSETELSFYANDCEIAIFSEDGVLKQLRVPGLTFHKNVVRPIAIEIGKDIYAPILDSQGNILKLIHLQNKDIVSYAELDPWGTNLESFSPISPWIFNSKHYDLETNLVYFGYRYYDPEIKEWISPDPLGQVQSNNLYQYCLNNPIRYIDIDGRFAIVIPLVVWGGGTASSLLIDAALLVGATWLGYEAVKQGNKLVEAHKHKDGKQRWNSQIE